MTARKRSSAEGTVVRFRAARPCPICGKVATRTAYPFCSARCADIDLNRWLSNAYAIPGTEDAPPDEDPSRE